MRSVRERAQTTSMRLLRVVYLKFQVSSCLLLLYLLKQLLFLWFSNEVFVFRFSASFGLCLTHRDNMATFSKARTFCANFKAETIATLLAPSGMIRIRNQILNLELISNLQYSCLVGLIGKHHM